MAKIALTGITGGLGSRVLHHLLHTLRIPPSSLILCLHNPSGLPSALTSQFPNLDIRAGLDYLSPASLTAAFAGADMLLLVSYPGISHATRVQAHRHAIDAARAAGVAHVVYTSLAFAGDSRAEVMQAHIDTEAYLREACKDGAMRFTVLREGLYHESYPLYLGFLDVERLAGEAPERRRVVVPADGAVAWVARDDLGEGTARVLVDETGAFDGKTLLLSGDVPLTLKELAGKVSEVLGWTPPLRVDTVGEEAYVEEQLRAGAGRGQSEDERREFLRKWATTYPALVRGEAEVVDPLLGRLLGRRLKSVEETLREVLGVEGSARESLGRYAK